MDSINNLFNNGSTTHYDYDYDKMTMMSNNSYAYEYYSNPSEYNKNLRKATYDQILDDREKFRYVYHVFAGCIVVLNILVIVIITSSRKRRSHFRNWLILHIMCMHVLFGGVGLPYTAQSMEESGAGLNSVALCKSLAFLSDITEYMSNISIGILGIYHCLNLISTRLLKSVSNALLVSVLLILPWFIVLMLSAVLRLTMSEEQYGQCYIISDETAQYLWLTMACCVPLTIVLACFLTIIYLMCSPTFILNDRYSSGRHFTLFVSICLGACFFLRTPFYIVFFEPLKKVNPYKYNLAWTRMTHGLDAARLTSMVVIPLAYLIPMEFKKRYRKLKLKILCKDEECTTTNKKSQTMDMVPVSHTDRTVV
ncbi:hypothetical protein ACF0H5_017325 [Mactra antiquata]